jgi:CheY-like chemotaxis protein
MESIGTVIQGLAALAWPIIVVVILFSFRDVVRDVLGSAKSRKFTLKVGGSELTMEEASEQQRVIISDLQNQIVAMQKTLDTLTSASGVSLTTAAEIKPNEVKSILWVDDHPRNNATLIEHLTKLGIEVVTALSTSEALVNLAAKNFERVVSDMGRTENGQFHPTAGLDLVRQIHATNSNVPIIIYSSSRTAQTYKQEALAAGAKEITSSPTALINALQLGVDMTSA